MFCKNCGREIDDKAVFCIHCGVAIDKVKKINGLGLAGFVVSLVSLYFGVYFCIASIVGLVLSVVGMVNAKKCRLNGFAIAGLVIGIISVLIWAIVWIILGALIFSTILI